MDGVVPRFTPASAGNIAIASHRKWGETGSPPHPRGIWYSCSRPRSPARFTPASAGNIAKRELDSSSRRVHPRIRGEYMSRFTNSSEMKGSPPHPRGIFIVPAAQFLYLRFTPASAGNILNYLVKIVRRQVHPRIRGEYMYLPRDLETFSGSPPHPRGISPLISSVLLTERFTPASAGNIGSIW